MNLRSVIMAFAISAALCMHGLAQATGTCVSPPVVPLNSNSALVVESRSAEIEVLGTDQDGIRVSCRLTHQDKAEKIKVSFSGTDSSGTLHLKGGPRNNVYIRIEVPRNTDLTLHATAGGWKVTNVVGNKEIELSFGDISVAPVSLQEYASVEASTRIGEVHVPGKDVTKKEFFQRFTKNPAPGKYRLKIHLKAGDIKLE